MPVCGTGFEIGRDEGIWGKNDVGGSGWGNSAVGLRNTHRHNFDCGDGLGVCEGAFLFLGDTTRARLLQITLAFCQSTGRARFPPGLGGSDFTVRV